ncbi:hypothetical protein B0T22DRAFT_113891 [Podospora appendiculata]|uniref:CorA-like transporter domain-containing protein n=1 Tax=Podospora appendiculata TaxID=314037 RepID=A0AAE1CIJ4_9PEZI|nr:hypothetical protein B0T22DRAFT_113891 [Podospora appendiculata]
MAEIDSCDRFWQANRDFEKYPFNMLRSVPKDTLAFRNHYLVEHDQTLFDREKAQILLWELWPGYQKFQKSKIESSKILQDHLLRNEKDPKTRHIFLESDHSRAGLNCSSAMFKMLLTFQQVEPSFLDYCFTFGEQDEPSDACLSHFQYDDALAVQDRHPFLAPLGRSGRAMRHSFLLRSVERDDEATWPWSIRQVAVYHSFDVVNGRTVWITVKGNDVIQKRIVDDTENLPVLRAAVDGSVTALFEAALATHLIYFRWCEENWRWFVRDVEDHIRGILVKAKTLPVDQQPHCIPSRINSDVASSSRWHRPSASFQVTSEKPGFLQSFMQHRRFGQTTSSSHIQQQRLGNNFSVASKGKPDDMHALEVFKYQDLQVLNIVNEKVEEGILTITLSIRVLADICIYYERLADSEDIGGATKGEFKEAISKFVLKVHLITASLATRKTQLESLRNKLAEGKTLFESLLQFRSLQVSRIFAEQGHRSAVIMEKIAIKTEQETVSMHIITFVALLFLPPTFVATFFQSGILEWEPSSTSIEQWLFRADAFKLFVAISIPLTVVILIGWWVLNYYGRSRSRMKFFEDGCFVPAASDAVMSPV